MNYEVLTLRRAQKQLGELPLRDYDRVKASISALGNIPRPHGCLKLTSRPGWRIRIGNYRVIYEIDDLNQTVTILDVGNRRDVYN
jgi:mRNA interferase RelE/StbE